MTENEVNERIRTLCRARSWSIYRLAKQSGITYSTLSTMLSQDNIPTISTLIKICAGFGISVSQFFNDSIPVTLEQEKHLKRWVRLSDEEQAGIERYIDYLLYCKDKDDVCAE